MNRMILITVALAGAACSGEEPGRLPPPEEPVTVTVSPAARAPASRSYPAQVVSRQTAEIATRMSGTVERVTVDVGSRVRRGQELVIVDATDVRARVRAALAAERLARRAHARVAALARDGAASQQELDQAEAALESALAGRADAEAQEAYAVVRAPFDGVVTRRDTDPGDLAVPGRSLLTMVQPGALEVQADLPAADAAWIEPGTPLLVRTTGVEAGVAARVSRVVPALDAGSRRVRVEASLASGLDLLPGSYARVEVGRPGRGPRWIPSDAVLRRGQLAAVYALEGEHVRLRWVRLGRRRGDGVELLAGPRGDLNVVRRPPAALRDGVEVAAVSREEWTPPVVASAEVER